jgi:alpha-L-fucosidase
MQATWSDIDPSLADRTAPAWFRDAKLGIFIHWGIYSVPGWSPTTGLFTNAAELGWEEWFRRNPYAEWYENSLAIPGSPTADHHRETYGDAPYAAFAPEFARASAAWQPERWAELFARAGARYAVLTTKHHDGYCLWPTAVPHPHQPGWHSERDLVGELADAVRARGLRFGTYYSGGLDWSWHPAVVHNHDEVRSTFRQDAPFIAYLDAQWRELIERYGPDLLWNDIGAPAGQDVPALFRDYLDRVPDGVIDNRFQQCDGEGTITFQPPFDFTTPEYATSAAISPVPFESCRGVGYSFGYNQLEDESTYIGTDELIHFFVDLVSKNGNLLLNVGPRADGSIPEGQIARLEALGDWLAVNGEAIYGTRPWKQAEGRTLDGAPVRFTRRNGALYAIVLAPARPGARGMAGLRLSRSACICLLGREEPLSWVETEAGIAYTLPEDLPAGAAHALKISPAPSNV